MTSADDIYVAGDHEDLVRRFRDKFSTSYFAAVGERGSFTVSLSGGSTPKTLYERLIDVPVDWSKVFFFFGDERWVPADHADSNYRMAFGALFSPLGIRDDNVYRWWTELNDPQATASDYSQRLTKFFGGTPRIDLFLLGLGPDAHTASLFPQTAALGERIEIAVANRVPKLDAWRLTLTPPAINNSRRILFIVTGAEKADAVAAVIEGENKPFEFPAQLIKPISGTLDWLLDEPAASGLASR